MLGDGRIVTNWLGLFVLLSIFVLTHIIAAITSFRMITLIPHHVPRLIGFSAANRVDMDEWGQAAGIIGTQKALGAIASGVDPKRLTSGSGAGSNEGQGGQRMIGSNAKNAYNGNSTGSGGSGVDTTVQATTSMDGGMPEMEDD